MGYLGMMRAIAVYRRRRGIRRWEDIVGRHVASGRARKSAGLTEAPGGTQTPPFPIAKNLRIQSYRTQWRFPAHLANKVVRDGWTDPQR